MNVNNNPIVRTHSIKILASGGMRFLIHGNIAFLLSQCLVWLVLRRPWSCELSFLDVFKAGRLKISFLFRR